MSEPLPLSRKIIHHIDNISIWSGKLVAWLIIPMVLGLVYEVVARYVFNAPTEWAYDLTFMLYGSLFMLGAAFTLQRKGHIRTDTLYANWHPRTQGWVDICCYLLFFFPALIAFFWLTSEFFWVSFQRGERIVTSPWMPIVYPFKAVMPIAAALLILQGISELLKSIHAAIKGEWL